MISRKLLIALLCLAPVAAAQKPDPDLLAKIRAIRAIDNHSHPPKLVSAGEADTEFDALPCDPLEPTLPTLTSRPENPQFIAAWKALYGLQIRRHGSRSRPGSPSRQAKNQKSARR